MKVYAVQLDIVWENKQANLDKVSELLEDERIEKGSLIVLPEMFATGFSMNVEGIHDSESHITEVFLSTLARQYESYIVGGLVTRREDGRGRNEAVVFDPSGKPAVRYTKLHPFTLAGETNYYSAGTEPYTFECDSFTVSPFVCYDLRFPEIFRHAVQLGANLFLVIANWPVHREQHWISLLRARAIENQAYVVGVNRCGQDPHHPYSGHSQIIDPKGCILMDAGSEERVVCADLDIAMLEQYRKELPFLADMRPEYKLQDTVLIGRK